MSFMIHLQSFKNGAIATFPQSIVWNIFGHKCVPTNEGWGVIYDGRPGGVLYLDDDEMTDGFSINRPCDASFYDLYAVARLVPSLINASDCAAVADASFIAGIPSWLLKALGRPPAVVHSGNELLDHFA